MEINLKANPFFLDEDGVNWVKDTLTGMTLEEKAGQVFCPMGFNNDPAFLTHLVNEIGIGGIMYRPAPAEDTFKTHQTLQGMAKIPLLLAANTEAGGNGLVVEGTSFGSPMAVAATGDAENGYRMGKVACREGAALGLNWSFTPIVDIDKEFHNPITNVRTFGSNPERVLSFASRYMDAANEENVAVAIKHFPGDGVDERDQHILTSVNSLSVAEWEESYGKVYRALIEKGAKTVMVGHIANPAYVKEINPNAAKEELLRPASLSWELLTGLLREKIGFNGLISTDSTPMVGFTAAMPRHKAIPTAIASGADMILFNKSLEEDFGFLLQGIRDGILSEERLDEAVTRILATKASLGLHIMQKEGVLAPNVRAKDMPCEKEAAIAIVGCKEHQAWAKEVADNAITLVRDEQKLLPISPAKTKRVYLNVIQRDMEPTNPLVTAWKEKFEAEGFEVTVRNRTTKVDVPQISNPESATEAQRKMVIEMYRSIEDMKKDYDLYVYVCNMENASNNTTLRLNWNVAFGLGDDAPWFAAEIPVLMISTAYPYHLFDAPMIKTYINTYSKEENFIDATIEKLMGRSDFKGQSPVDPLCGKDYI